MAIRMRNRSVKYEEKAVGNLREEVLKLAQNRDYELVIVGKRLPSIMEANLPVNLIELHELGPVGDILVSSDGSIMPSVLVIQQQEILNSKQTAGSEMVRDEETAMDASIKNYDEAIAV